MSLQTRFILLYGLGSVFFLILVTLLVFTRMQAEMVEQLEQQFVTDARGKIEGLSRSLQQTKERFRAGASVPMFRAMRFHQLTMNQAALQDDIRQLELYFLDQQMNQEGLDVVRFIDTKGAELLRVEYSAVARKLKDLSVDAQVRAALQLEAEEIKVTASRVGNEIRELVWWVPVFVSKEVRLGVLVFHISFDAFRDRVLTIGMEGLKWVCVGEGGVTVISSKHGGQCGKGDDGHWHADGNLGLPGLHWTATLHADPEVFLVDVHRLRWIVFALILPLVATLAFFMAVMTSRQIAGAVREVVAAARVLGKGERFLPIEIKRRDELGQLAGEVNRAAALIQEKTMALEDSNRELESYSYSIAHDLRAPLRAVTGFSQILEMDTAEKLNDEERDSLRRVIAAGARMSHLIDDILELSRISRRDIGTASVDLSALVREIAEHLAATEPDRAVEWSIQEGITVKGDPQLLRVLMENLLGNAWKYSRGKETTRIGFGREKQDGRNVYFVRDNGVGFDMKYAENLFKPFQRLHRADEFEGSGVGLATVKRVVHRHNGEVWADAEVGKFAAVYFTLGE